MQKKLHCKSRPGCIVCSKIWLRPQWCPATENSAGQIFCNFSIFLSLKHVLSLHWCHIFFWIFSFCILISCHGDARHGELSRGYFVQQTNKQQHCNLTGGNVHKSGFPSKWLHPTKRSQHTEEHTCYRALRANLWELDFKSRFAWWILESSVFCMFIIKKNIARVRTCPHITIRENMYRGSW